MTRATTSTGAHVGRYVVLEEIGRGGMGRVLRAYDPKLRREVALKEVGAQSLGSTGARRLVAEARAMAKLSHPNVVAVYDVEVAALDDVVVVMEYVEGMTLAQWLAGGRRWPEIVAAFVQAGRGLAAAHGAGLLHRDFKPDNVLVGVDGRVRVTDFGLAREVVSEPTADLASDPGPAELDSGEKTTTRGVVGTLPYLAPERLTGSPADPSTDQFAFCVSLWEALFGKRPFAGRSVIELSVAMAAGPPRAPSRTPRLPAPLVATLSRGLSMDPDERWPSMEALLAALARDAEGRGRLWARGVAAVLVVGLAAAGAHTWISRGERCSVEVATGHLHAAWNDDRRAEVHDAMLQVGTAYAADTWARVERALDEYAQSWTTMHVQACEATAIRGEQSEAILDLRMACLRAAGVELGAVVDVLRDADANTVQRGDRLVAGLRPLQRCADIQALQAEVEPPLPADAATVDAARAELARARASADAGRSEDARGAIEAATAMIAELDYAPVRVEAAHAHGVVLYRNGEYDDARAALREALRLAAGLRYRDRVQSIASNLAYVVGYELHRYDEGLRYAEISKALTEPGTKADADLANDVALILDAKGDHDAAEAEHRRVLALRERLLGPDHPDVAASRNNLANSLYAKGELAAAEAELRRVVELRAALGSDHPDVATAHGNLAVILVARGKPAEAERESRAALELMQRVLEPDHPRIAMAHNNLGDVLFELEDFDAAEAELRRGLALAQTAVGETHPQTAWTRNTLAKVLRAKGEHAQAEIENRRALELLEQELGPDHERVAQVRVLHGTLLGELGRYEEAEAEHRSALAIREKVLGADHHYVAASRLNLAQLLLERGRVDEAWELADEAYRAQLDDADLASDERAHGAFVLAKVSWADGAHRDRARAVELAERALVDYVAVDGDDSTGATNVRAWLREHASTEP